MGAKNKQPRIDDKFVSPDKATWNFINEDLNNDTPKVVDGQYVLARLQGQCFLVEGESLNSRYYKRSLWENCIHNIQPKLERGGIFGTVGHEQPIDENALLTGKISHKVTKLWIDEKNRGMGEILVLGTDAGRQLNACLRAGMPIPVSSRAYGSVSGKTESGADIIDPETFMLESFDFVLSPGVESAYPQVVESAKEGNSMDEKEKLIAEKIELQAKLNTANESTHELKAKLEEAKANMETLKKAIHIYREAVGPLKDLKKVTEGLRKWLQLEPLRSWALKQKLLPNSKTYIPDYSDALSVTVESFVKHGSPDDVAKKFESLRAYEALGSAEDLKKVCDVLEDYVAFGSPAKVKEIVESAKKAEVERRNEVRKNAAVKIAKTLEVKESVVEGLLKRLPVKEAIETLKAIKESSDLSNRYRVDESKKQNVTELFKAVNEDGSEIEGTVAGRAFADMR